MVSILEFISYWSIIIIPFSVAISIGLSNTFLGFLAFVFFVKKIIKRERPFTNNVLLVPFLLFLAVAFISFKNSVSYSGSFQGIIKLLKSGLIFLICAEEIRGVEHIKKIILAIVAGIVLVSVDALWQLRFGWDFVRGEAVQSCLINLARPTGPFPNPNVMGIYLVAIAPIVIGLFLYYYKGREKISWGIVSLLAAAGIYITLSRGSGLGLFFSVLFLAIVRKHKTLIAILVAIFLIYPVVMPKNIRSWAASSNYNPLVFLFNQDRLSMYMNATNMISHHPFIGVGVNTYAKNYAKYKTLEAEKYAHTQDTAYAQSNYFQMAGEMGLVGLSIFIWFLWLLFRELIRYYRSSKDDYLKVVSISLVACFIAFLINSLTESSLYYSRVAVMFWYLVGISLAIAHEK
ncbi:MAG: O-antigen ligase family protein [Candidatus Omnitrophica bacterium]|nr:O-antigen ligase family protein [Candidatus Omnitrophota bacterium]